MNFYDKPTNVQAYLDMSKGYDNTFVIDLVKTYIPKGKSILELGMGPGKDLRALSQDYVMTGSDRSEIFVDMFKKKKTGADVMTLDAVTLQTDRHFDAIYSNKVLMHLTREGLVKSITRQYEVLNDGGMIFHTLWYGEGSDDFDGMVFNYYDEDGLIALFSKHFEIIASGRYDEMDAKDSIYIVGKKIRL